VEFAVDVGILGAVPLVSGTASYIVTKAATAPQDAIVATYSGDATYAPRSFSATHTILPPTYVTRTMLSVTPLATLASQTVRFVATVTCTPPVPTGVVTFLDGSNSLGRATVDASGIAFFDTALLAAGVHNLSARFNGYNQPSTLGTGPSYTLAIFTPSTSPPVTDTVASNATTTTISSSSPSAIAGTVVTFTAQVSSTSGVPFGSATFLDGSSTLGTLGLNADGSLSFSTASLATGVHSITAIFNASGPFASSASSAVMISMLPAPAALQATVVSLATDIDPADGHLKLAANVSASNGAPSGPVTFLDNGLIVGLAGVGPTGMAILKIGTMASGTHSLSASFAGGLDFAPSASPEFRDQWPDTGPGFFLKLGTRVLRSTSSGSYLLPVTIVPIASFEQTVQLSCPDASRQGFTCSFSLGTINSRGTSILTIQSHGRAAVLHGMPLYFAAFGFVSLFFLGIPGRRSRGLLLGYSCLILIVLAGCSVASSPGVPAQSAVLTIRATSGTGAEMIIHSTQVTVFLPSVTEGQVGRSAD
jgi:hypothetical protein